MCLKKKEKDALADLVRRRVATEHGRFLVARLASGDTGRPDAGGNLGVVGRHGVRVELGRRAGSW